MMMKDQVLSWLNDEESVVTCQRIHQASAVATPTGQPELSRQDASQLLQTILDEEDEDPNKYVATVCTMETTTTTASTTDGYSTTGEFT